MRLKWDATDAAAVIVDRDGMEPEIWIGAVSSRTPCRSTPGVAAGRGIADTVRLFHLPTAPRGANGKVRREALATAMRASADLVQS